MPLVSVIVPCYNEEKTILLLLEALLHQEFPLEEMEVVIADGNSTDTTVQKINSFIIENPGLAVRVVHNQKRTIPAGLNLAIREAHGEFIIRVDAHSRPYNNYIALCVTDLQQGKGDNVGGIWEIKPGGTGWLAKAIALAASHPFGVGDALYRYTDQPAYVDTVPFGAFHRKMFDKIGYFNEELLTNEDYELNTRIIRAGGKIWLNPAIRSVYFARPNLLELARQYWRYGYWKARMLMNNISVIRMRQILPPLFVSSLIIIPLISLFYPPAIWLFLVEIGIYFLALIVVGLLFALKQRNMLLIPGIPLAITVMHICWGGAFLWSVGGSVLDRKSRGRQ